MTKVKDSRSLGKNATRKITASTVRSIGGVVHCLLKGYLCRVYQRGRPNLLPPQSIIGNLIYRPNMATSSNSSVNSKGSDERPIRPLLLGEARVGEISQDGVSKEAEVVEVPKEPIAVKAPRVHPFCVLLNFTTKDGLAVTHPAFGEDAVRDLCARRMGRKYDRISRLNITDFMVEFDMVDNPTLFATGMGRQVKWLGMDLDVDAHIGAPETLGKVSRQREEAQRVLAEAAAAAAAPPEPVPSVPTPKPPVEKVVDEVSERESYIQEKEDAMLKVLESMSKRIEQLDQAAKSASSSTIAAGKLEDDIKTSSARSLAGGAQRRDGVYLMEQLPRVGSFSGEKPTPKGEIDFKTWKSDVTGNLQNYPETSLRPGIRSSLRGNAKELLEGLPDGASVHQILEMLTKQYGTVESSDQLLGNFYQMSQNKGEEIANFAARLVGALNKIQKRFPHLVPAGDREGQLRERLFHGMHKPYRDALRYLYSNKDVGYYDFLEEARKVQECDEKLGTAVKAKSAQAQAENDSDNIEALRSQVAEMVAVLKAAKVNGPPFQNQKDGKDNRNLKGPQTSAAGPFRGRDKPVQCFKCQGWGHYKRECPSPENYPRGEGGSQGPPPGNNQQQNQQTNAGERAAAAPRPQNQN